MKKTLLIVALAAILVLAMAVPAFAVNRSGQQRLGAPVGLQSAIVSGTVTPGAGTNTYQDWNTALGENAINGNSPHGNYTTTTVKCVVCHAVHYAAPGNAPVSSGLQTADTLLRMKASDSCVFCHATDGMAVNGFPVYDGKGDTITAADGHITGANCSMCHTGVHGANADHSVASLDGYLLKLMPQAGVTVMNVPTANMIEAIAAIDHNAENQGFAAGDALAGTIGDYASSNTSVLREQAVGVFCAQCHNGAYATGAAGASTNVLGSSVVAYSGHRIAAAATTDWNADGSKSSSTFSGTVAFAAATNCKSCHDGTDKYAQVGFPHSWGGTKMWLMSAADAGVTVKDHIPTDGAYDTTVPQLSDGVCLKCHVASDGTGVGVTF